MNVFDQFKAITNLDIKLFFTDVSDFINTTYQSIVNYYTKDQNINNDVFIELDELIERSILINSAFTNYKDQLSLNTEFWELLDTFDEARVKLLTINNSARWLRSTRDTIFNDDVNPTYTLRQGQTLESVSREIGDTIPQDDWTELAIKNGLEETDYTAEGGNLLSVSFKNNAKIQINSVVDSLQGKKIYGLDVDKEFTIDLTTEDLTVLGNDDTINQSFETLIGTTKGSIPEFAEDGVDKSVVGTNLNAIQYPIIFRQLSSLFQKDDRFKSFAIISIDQGDDRVELTVQANTRLDEVLNQNIGL